MKRILKNTLRSVNSVKMLFKVAPFEGEQRANERAEVLAAVNEILFATVRKQKEMEIALKREMNWLHLLSQITAIANESVNTRFALHECIEQIAIHSDWTLGHVYEVERKLDPSLVSSGIWYSVSNSAFSVFTESTLRTMLKSGEGLVGRAFASKKIEWIEDIELTSTPYEFKRLDSASAEGLRSAIAVPVIVGREVTHIMEFYSDRVKPTDLKLLHVLEQIGVQIGRAVERERSLDKLNIERLNLASKSKMAALGEMAAGIGHEINTPLSIIYARTVQIKSRLKNGLQSDHKSIEWLDQIEGTVKRITKIISGLKNSVRQRDCDPFVSTSIKSLVEDTLTLCHSSLIHQGIQISISPIEGRWEVECRSAQISQILLNLLSNSRDAIEFHKEKWIRISVSEGKDEIQIEVSDSGKGISSDMIDKLFQPFFTTKEVGRGTGIGLSISRGIADSHGGKLEYTLKDGHTCFVLSLPKAQLKDQGRSQNLGGPSL